jgi:hypothetical protein
MGHYSTPGRRPGRLRALSLGISLMAVAAACDDGERLGPTTGTEPSGAEPAAAVVHQGIVFASSALTPSQLNSVHTGTVNTPSPSGLLKYLAQIRAKKGRVFIKLAGGERTYRNSDGTFNLTKWKAGVDRYRKVNFSSYVADGTIIGHVLIDEPHFASRWGDQSVPQAVVEAAAKHSKSRWPNLTTMVAAPASWLAQAPVTYVHLDAGWATFRSKTSSNPGAWAAQQVNRAKQKKLGLVAGLNVLDGGNGSSGIRGSQPKDWAMSAAELRAYGSALLSQSYVCAWEMWRYSGSYYNRADIKSAMSYLSSLAKKHAKTSCRQ